mmetsp:Transcript_13133/g.18807  ORF Transcript_13133/g.18807 Transcript_13133/m.18807 type:complete len:176 (+) Transcript_13133:28-555(+)
MRGFSISFVLGFLLPVTISGSGKFRFLIYQDTACQIGEKEYLMAVPMDDSCKYCSSSSSPITCTAPNSYYRAKCFSDYHSNGFQITLCPDFSSCSSRTACSDNHFSFEFENKQNPNHQCFKFATTSAVGGVNYNSGKQVCTSPPTPVAFSGGNATRPGRLYLPALVLACFFGATF